MQRERSLRQQAAFLHRKARAMRTTGEHITVILNGKEYPLNRLDPDDILDEAKAFDRMARKLATRNK